MAVAVKVVLPPSVVRMVSMMADEVYFQRAADEAARATCYRARCGSVVVSSGGEVIGRAAMHRR